MGVKSSKLKLMVEGELEPKRRRKGMFMLLDDDEAAIRRRAVDALGQTGQKKVAKRLVSVMRSDRDVDVRAAAARALAGTYVR